MCGITGIFGFDDPGLLRRMTSIISHRGPDDSGFFTDKNIGLGHRRLSIIDLKTGRQPIHNEDRTVWIVYNGEIYNYKELREGLERKNHDFYTNSDTEVIVHLYEDMGKECVKKLRGMFAFAIWDSRKRELFLGRDHIGIKPLYYLHTGEKFLFSSEIKSILEFGEFKRELSYQSLYDYLTFGYVQGENTLFKNIKKLPPAHTLIINRDGIKKEGYWSLRMETKKSDYINEFMRIFRESVKMRMISDVPLGAFLSGGIDSSSVVAMMASLTADGRSEGASITNSKWVREPVKTFSVGFGEESDELKFAREVSDLLGTEHEELTAELSDVPKLLPKIIWHIDDGMADAAVFPTYLISERARKKVKVILTGEGADELFAGYQRYRYLSPLGRFIPGNLKLKAYLYQVTLFRDREKRELFGREIKEGTNVVKSHFSKKDLNNVLLFEMNTSLPNDLLIKVDKTTMAHGLEARVPFLDRGLMEFSGTIPQSMKLRWFTGKHILKKAVKGMLPDSIINRKKHGFTVPLSSWLKEDLREFTEQSVMDEEFNRKMGFNGDYIKILFPTKTGFRRSGDALRLWRLLVFNLWHRIFIDQEKVKI